MSKKNPFGEHSFGFTKKTLTRNFNSSWTRVNGCFLENDKKGKTESREQCSDLSVCPVSKDIEHWRPLSKNPLCLFLLPKEPWFSSGVYFPSGYPLDLDKSDLSLFPWLQELIYWLKDNLTAHPEWKCNLIGSIRLKEKRFLFPGWWRGNTLLLEACYPSLWLAT